MARSNNRAEHCWKFGQKTGREQDGRRFRTTMTSLFILTKNIMMRPLQWIKRIVYARSSCRRYVSRMILLDEVYSKPKITDQKYEL